MLKSKNAASSSRLERWKENEYLGPTYAIQGDDSQRDLIDLLLNARRIQYEKHGIAPSVATISDWIKGCKELIFDIVDGYPRFHGIAYSFDVSRAEIKVSPLFEMPISGKTEDDVKEEVRVILASALFAEVPVIPNTEDLAEELAHHHSNLMIEGFLAQDASGVQVRLKVARSPGKKVETIEYLTELPASVPRQTWEWILLRNAFDRELNRLIAAHRVLENLTLAIEDLSAALGVKDTNERTHLQGCLTKHPILFGLDYQRVLSQHSLGKEYTIDYALERISGIVDIVEIEASTHELFTLKGDPRKELVHAEQQVLNYLDWLEENFSYATKTLPGLMRPRGYVVIGRSNAMSSAEQRKLARRNQTFGDSLQILTYDDLLARATNMKNVLLRRDVAANSGDNSDSQDSHTNQHQPDYIGGKHQADQRVSGARS